MRRRDGTLSALSPSAPALFGQESHTPRVRVTAFAPPSPPISVSVFLRQAMSTSEQQPLLQDGRDVEAGSSDQPRSAHYREQVREHLESQILHYTVITLVHNMLPLSAP